MINYMKSEYYRLLRKKGVHFTSVICLLLIVVAATVLQYLDKVDPTFPYATSNYFYSNVIALGLIIIIIGFIFNSALTSKDDMSLIKQTVSFGISRNTIFWSKLILTLSYFVLICVIGIFLMIALGESLLITDNHSVHNFLMASVNMAPLVLSGFILTHVLKVMKVRDVYIFILLLFIYGFSSNLVRMLFRPFQGLSDVYKYMPNTLFNDNLGNYIVEAVPFSYESWVIGIGISLFVLFIGANRFAKQNID
ncbi:ABC transporter permease [Sutcliffiella sp. NC1]|uniref:ABC transporter permease n=1 Tax=Sutcliffiella sp. NC1 TaxID=3004096 RepID=UPI0022DD35DC|nr:ABC transporter permease [Sutcliffiella sp. NC1]WBL16785.1 ABC transporter permease [Sutcliffiella sp. NC1]